MAHVRGRTQVASWKTAPTALRRSLCIAAGWKRARTSGAGPRVLAAIEGRTVNVVMLTSRYSFRASGVSWFDPGS